MSEPASIPDPALARAIPQPPLWGGLTPGRYAVGFTSRWEFDLARRYAWPTPDKAHSAPQNRRPILLHVWYPARHEASRKPMLHREYLAFEPPGPLFQEFTAGLADFQLGVVAEEVVGKPRGDLDPAEEAALARVLAAPTAAVRDATPIAEAFPLVINHGGLGASIEDNSVLFELLASHGYVVAASAFQSESASWFNIDWDLERSMKDLDLLVNSLRRQPNVDPDRLGIMGQSFGGQAALAYRAESNSTVDAVVSLDATIEYISPEEWAGRRPRFAEKLGQSRRMSAPILVFTQRAGSPRFDIYEAMTFAERYLVQVDHLKHNDFLAHGAIGADLRRQRDPEAREAALVRKGYELVCRWVLRFLDAFLKNDAQAMASLRQEASAGGADPGMLAVEYREAAPLPAA